MFPHGILRITAAAPALSLAHPETNAAASIRIIEQSDSDLIVFPELGLTGYTCGDLFASDTLLRSALIALDRITIHSLAHDAIVVVGLPLAVGDTLMNVAAVVSGGQVRGIVPKSFLPTYREFYDGRHFRAASDVDPPTVEVNGSQVAFGTDLLFEWGEATIAVEICEDLWTPIPPTSHAALAGANVLVNLSASNETIGKAAWRRELVRSQSGRCIAAYAYASSGPGESSSDLVFGGHCLIAENGDILDQSRRVGDGIEPLVTGETEVTCDVDLQRIAHDRRVIGSFDDARSRRHLNFRRLPAQPSYGDVRPLRSPLKRTVVAHPFVPTRADELESRCSEILAIQVAGLTRRLSILPPQLTLTIGVSGGLDSTLALLVAIRACDAIGKSRRDILGITMPGFGTTRHTGKSAKDLMAATGITSESVDIRQLCLDTFRAIGHRPLGIELSDSTGVDDLQVRLSRVPDGASDLTFENVQARIRTMILMNRGFVLGTGDMSEQALGWSTYNADHMSMYNVNTSIPKTLVRFLVRYAADHDAEGDLTAILHRVADTPISPELMPPREDGSLRQSTEATIGAYELHDFFLYHFVRNGFSRDKIRYLAEQATFDEPYSSAEITETLDTFFRRFFANQFKRNCVPDGPKVGSVSLSPRGDWRMPSDAEPDAFGETE